MKLKPVLFVPFVCLALSSCGTIHTKSETYGKSESTRINDAAVSAAVQPQGDDGSFSLSAMVVMAGAAKLKGPFNWRIEAEGTEGVHESMTVHRVTVTTEKTRRSEPFPADRLGTVKFKPLTQEEGNKNFAAFQLPGKLEVYSDVDGPFAIEADVSVKSRLRTERKRVRFQMQPASESDTEFLFIPTEIIRGWKESPRAWQWRNVNPLNY